MDLNSPMADHLFILLSAGVVGLMMTERTIHLAMMKVDGDTPNSDIYIPGVSGFFGHDSVIFILTLFGSLFSLLPAVAQYGAGNVNAFLTAARSQMSLEGWSLTFLVVIQIMAPFIVGTCLLIGRHRRMKYYGFV